MKKTMVLLMASLAFGVFLSGCGGSNVSSATSLERKEKYSKIAIVCAPVEGASADYVTKILAAVEGSIPKKLGYLNKATCVKDASIDVSSSPPVVNFPDKEGYEGIVCLLYSYNNGMVIMDIKMLDNRSGQEVWSKKISVRDPDIKDRLYKDGLYVPSFLANFYKGK